MKWQGTYDVFRGAEYMYSVPDYEAHMELHNWIDRGYSATIDHNKWIIDIGKKTK